MSNHFDNFEMPNTINESTFPIGSFNALGSNFGGSEVITNGTTPNNSGVLVKETGIIEKMLISYGFIQCCERQARLFFHFSQFNGNTNHLKIGDPVEYEMSYDKRTGKPVAVNIRKIMSCDFMDKMKTTERVSGVIASDGREGRVAFENMGEFFFLPFSQSDVVGGKILKAQDNVSFIIVSDESGNYRAKDIELEQSSFPCKGVVASIKDTFGFIDCLDNSSNKIFFHSSDCKNFHQLEVGDRVEFLVSSRKGKELATNIAKIVNVAEQVTDASYNGLVVKYNARSNPGSGILKCIDQDKDYIFYDKDVNGTFTLCEMDLVTFQFIVDRKSNTMRPTNIQLNLNTFKTRGEERFRGYIASLNEIYGFIKCPNKEKEMIYFKLTEFITDSTTSPKLNDELEFSFVTDEVTKKNQAIRILYLPNGTLFSMLNKKSNHNNNNSIERTFSDIVSNGQKDMFTSNGMDHFHSNGHDEQHKSAWGSNGMEALSSNLKNMQLNEDKTNGSIETNGHGHYTLMGVVVSIKDGYGFIESLDGEKDYYFHNSSFLNGPAELGQTVEFTPEVVKGKSKASDIRVNANIAIYESVASYSEQQYGIVMRTAQMFNAEQKEYTGYISPITNIDAQDIDTAVNFEEKYEFSLLSLKFVNDFVSIGDFVNYRVARNPVTNKLRAYQIEVVRPRLKGTINVLNRYYGFAKLEGNDSNGKNVYFSKSEYAEFHKLKWADVIEFYLVDNKNSNKMYAIDIKLVQANDQQQQQSQQFESSGSFKNFMREPREQSAKSKVVVLRQPRAPDGTNGFNVQY